MAWTPIADDFDAFSAAVINEYVGALNERRQALGQGTIGTYAEDDLVPNSAAVIRAWQQWIETNLVSFVVSHDGGVPREGGHYDGVDTIDTYANLVAVFAAAGLARTNWRRVRDHAFFAWGQAQEDDDYALELFEDIQKCLNVLVWTLANLAINPDNNVYVGEDYGAADWATAKYNAEADYHFINERWGGQAWTWGQYGGLDYDAGLSRTCEFSHATAWNGCVRYVDWYVLTEAAQESQPFDAYGDDVIEDKYSLFSQDEPANADETIISGTLLGQTAKPNNPWCAEPDTDHSPTMRGWRQVGRAVVVRWNVVGGFSYQ